MTDYERLKAIRSMLIEKLESAGAASARWDDVLSAIQKINQLLIDMCDDEDE